MIMNLKCLLIQIGIFKSSNINFVLHIFYLVMCKGGSIVLFTLIFVKLLSNHYWKEIFYQYYNRKTEAGITKALLSAEP